MNEKRHIFWGLTLAILLANLVIGFHVYSDDGAAESEERALEKLSVMMHVMNLIRQDYVETERADYENLLNNALHGMVAGLDPHSSYLEPADYNDMLDSTEGEFGGIGIIVTMRDDILTIVSPVEDTPGSRAGLQAGDRIIEIDGSSTLDLRMNEAVHLMKGEPGTKVELLIQRPKSDEEFSVTITRATIAVESVKDNKVLTDDIGYVRVTQFNENAAANLGRALEELEKQGMKKLVLDLRNNPGGLLKSAVEMCGYFLAPGALVVSTEGRRPSQNSEYHAARQSLRFKGEIVVLVNGGSASASEIVAGCLKDHERALLAGEKTFGKGSVQNLIPLPDSSALRLTTAMYHTPNNLKIHENGIEPDLPLEMELEDVKQLHEARMQALENGDEFDYTKDPQLSKAVEILQNDAEYNKLLKK